MDTGNFYGLLTKMGHSLKNVLPKSARLDLNLPPRNGSLRSKSRGQNTKKVANPLRISDLKMIGRGERGYLGFFLRRVDIFFILVPER